MFSIYQIKDAYNRISNNINKTPILFSDKINNLTKSNIIFKAENLQKTGSFKIFPIWPNQKHSSKRLILFAKKGGVSPTELMPGLRLFNKQGKIDKKARTYSDNGIFNFL